MVDFGNKIKTLRLSKNLSQEQLAARLSVTKSMISAYENSVRMPSYDVLAKIALFFHVSIDYLFGFDEMLTLDVSGLSEKQIAVLSVLIDEFKSK